MTRGFAIERVASIVLNGALDITEELVDAGRKAYCNLHQNHPAWTVARKFSDRSIILRAIDRMCDDGNYIAPKPVYDFTGGQCPGVTYNVITFQNTSFEGQTRSHRVLGPIKGIEYTTGGTATGNDGQTIRLWVGRLDAATTSQSSVTPAFYLDEGVTPPGQFIVRITDIDREDGLPDDCGNVEPFPPEPPPVDSELVRDIDITNNAGDTYTYNVTVNRDENNTINFPPTLVVNNVTMTMDITGITIIDNNNIEKPSGGDEGGLALEEPVVPEDKNADRELVVAIGAIEEDVTQLYGIIVKFNSVPVNEKNVTGYDGPRIIYGGWIQFKIGANYLPRIYMNYDNGYFLAPEGATGYAVSLKTGYNATIFKAYYVD